MGLAFVVIGMSSAEEQEEIEVATACYGPGCHYYKCYKELIRCLWSKPTPRPTKPTTRKPTTKKPTTKKPKTTQKPTTRKPTTKKPITKLPTTKAPKTTLKPTTRKPITTQEPTTPPELLELFHHRHHHCRGRICQCFKRFHACLRHRN